jgi:hypothetical protein
MTPQCITRLRKSGNFEPAPTANPRSNAVSSDNPPRADSFPANYRPFGRKPANRRIPQQSDAQLLRSLNHFSVQQPPPHADALAKWKTSVDFNAFVDKANPAKRKSFLSVDRYAKLAKNAKRIRHQTFAARFIDRRLNAVRHHNGEPSLARGDRSRKPSRPPAGDKHVRCLPHPCSSTDQVAQTTRITSALWLDIDSSFGQAQRFGPKGR